MNDLIRIETCPKCKRQYYLVGPKKTCFVCGVYQAFWGALWNVHYSREECEVQELGNRFMLHFYQILLQRLSIESAPLTTEVKASVNRPLFFHRAPPWRSSARTTPSPGLKQAAVGLKIPKRNPNLVFNCETPVDLLCRRGDAQASENSRAVSCWIFAVAFLPGAKPCFELDHFIGVGPVLSRGPPSQRNGSEVSRERSSPAANSVHGYWQPLTMNSYQLARGTLKSDLHLSEATKPKVHPSASQTSMVFIVLFSRRSD